MDCDKHLQRRDEIKTNTTKKKHPFEPRNQTFCSLNNN